MALYKITEMQVGASFDAGWEVTRRAWTPLAGSYHKLALGNAVE